MLDQGSPFGASTNLLGILLATGAALAISVMALTIRKETDEGNAIDALFVVILTNIVLFVPAAAYLYYPDYRLTPRSIAAFAAAGLVGTLLGRAFTYTSVERIGASRTEPSNRHSRYTRRLSPSSFSTRQSRSAI